MILEKHLKLSFFCFLLLLCPVVYAASIHIKDGNIFYEDGGTTKQVTTSGRDKEAKLNPGGEWIYFIRDVEGKWEGEKYYPPQGASIKGGLLKQELWRVKKDGSDAVMLFRSEHAAVDGPDPDYPLATVENIQFSPSGDKVYFETSEWVTSAGLHVMNADGSGEKLLGGGNDTRIVLLARDEDHKHNNYRGYIVTSQHRYWFFGGSYDWYWMFTPDFKEVGPLGEDFAYFTEMGDMKFTDFSEKDVQKNKSL